MMPTETLDKLDEFVKAHHQQDWLTAEQGYLSLIAKHPNSDKLHHYLGTLYLQLNQSDKALQYLEAALKINPNEPGYLNDLGLIHQRRGKTVLAEQCFMSAISLNPNYLVAYIHLANLLQKQHKDLDALKYFIKVTQLEPGLVEPHYQLGKLMLKLSRFDEALTQFNNVISLDESHLQAYFYIGAIQLSQKEALQPAEEAFKKVLALNPEHVDTLVNLGIIRLKQNLDQQAIELFSKALAYDNQSEEAQNNLAATFIAHHRYQNAVPHYQDLLTRFPHNIEYLYNLGVAYMNLSEFEQAKTLFLQLLKVDANHVDTCINIAAVFSRLKDKTNAIKYLNHAIDLNPYDNASKHMLNALTGKRCSKAPKEYSQKLFDGYAEHYDQHLMGKLEYQLPMLIEHQLSMVASRSPTRQILELGCGTGLVGMKLQHYAKNLIGVDISQKMLEKAAEKNCYHSLKNQEILTYLHNINQTFDVIVCADVLPYFGDLDDFFCLASRQLNEHGILIVSVEKGDEQEFQLQENGRFKHLYKYLEKLAHKYSLNALWTTECKLRAQNTTDVPGFLCGWQR